MLSSYLVAKLVDKILNNTDFTVTVPYFSLHTASPGTTGANELTAGSDGGSYTRPSCSSWDTSIPRLNTAAITWTNTPYATVTHFGIWDAVSGGNFLMGGALLLPLNIALGEQASFSAGRLAINCQSRFSTYLQPKILDKILKNTNFTVTAAYLSMHTGDPLGTGAEQQDSGSNLPTFIGFATFGSPSLASNTWTVNVTTTTNFDWTTMVNEVYDYVGLWDSQTSGTGNGNFLWGGALTIPVTATGSNDSTLRINSGNDVILTMTQVP